MDDPARQENWLLFARLGSKVVGTIGAYIPDPAADAARIVGVYVTPAARGKGVGKKLLQAIIAELARCGRFRRLTLSVNPQQAAALALYRSFGFEVAAVETTTMGDGKEYPEYEMERAL